MPHPSRKKQPQRPEFVTAEQKAEIYQFRIRRDELTADKLGPISIFICMFFPTLFAHGLLGPDKLLESPFQGLQAYRARALAASSTSLLDRALEARRDAFEYIRYISDGFPIKDYLEKYTDIDTRDPLDLFQIQADSFEFKGSTASRATIESMKVIFANALMKVAILATDVPELAACFSEVKDVELNEMGLGTVMRKGNEDALKKKSLSEMARLIRLGFQKLTENPVLDADNREKIVAMIGYSALVRSFALTHYTFMLGFVVCAAIFRNGLIEPGVNALYHRLAKTDHDPIQDFLLYDDAEEKIKLLKAEVSHAQTRSTQIMFGTAFAMLVALAISISNLSEKKEEYPALYVFIFGNLANLFYDFCKSVARQVSSLRFENEMKHITSQFNKAVAGTKTEWECVMGGTRASSHLQFYSDRIVGEVVKNTLAKKGVQIIAYEKDCVMVSPVSLSDIEANRMNEEIMAQLSRLAKIKKLTHQIKSYALHCSHEGFIKHLILDEDRLPVATYEFPVKSDVDLEKVKNIFSSCKVTQTDRVFYITGYAPAPHFDFSLLRPSAKQDPAARNEMIVPDSGIQRKKQVKKIEPAAEEKVVDEKPSDPIERIVFPSGVYDSSDPHCEIKKMNGLLNGKQHFVLFKLPEHCFPTRAMHRSAKNKVEEAEIASNAEGSQGAQLRPTWVKNQVDRKAGMFLSTVRYKLLGSHGKGKIRLHAQVEENAEGKCLDVYVGLDTKHKLRSAI